jgi:hypothetical protein
MGHKRDAACYVSILTYAEWVIKRDVASNVSTIQVCAFPSCWFNVSIAKHGLGNVYP